MNKWRFTSKPFAANRAYGGRHGTWRRLLYMIGPVIRTFFLHDKYIKEGLSASKIAKLVFSSKSTIQNALAQFGIQAREPHLHHGNPSQAKFGEKVRQGKLELHLFEQRTIDVVKLLRAQGLTLRQIAKVLDKLKMPTKERGKKWHPEMVRRILAIF